MIRMRDFMADAARCSWSVVLLAMQLTYACSEPQYVEPSRDAAAPTDCSLDHCEADEDLDAGDVGDARSAPKADAQTRESGTRDARVDGEKPGQVPRDAGSPREDAASVPSEAGAEASSAANALVGEYAMLARFFGGDSAGVGTFSEDIVSLASIRSGNDGKLTLTTHTCEHRSVIDPVVVAPIFSRVSWPEKLPQHVYQLNVEGNTFSTVGAPVLAGYEELSSTACPSGTTQSHPDRSWLPGGRCKCPISELPPTLPDDCRVVDSDGDKQPGLTVEFTGGTENLGHSRMRDTSQIVQGIVDAPGKKHRASFAPMTATYHLECVTSSCSNGSPRVCAAQFNPVRFVPLAARAEGRAWTCSDVMREIDDTGQFGLGAPSPSGC
jgi:hypothetical protein